MNDDVQIVVNENNVSLIVPAISAAITTALEEIGLVAEGAAKKLCPVDTGRLRNSITHAFEDDHSIVVGTNVEYALYVHEPVTVNGKTRQGTPFLTQAVQNNAGRFRSIMKKHVTGA